MHPSSTAHPATASFVVSIPLPEPGQQLSVLQQSRIKKYGNELEAAQVSVVETLDRCEFRFQGKSVASLEKILLSRYTIMPKLIELNGVQIFLDKDLAEFLTFTKKKLIHTIVSYIVEIDNTLNISFPNISNISIFNIHYLNIFRQLRGSATSFEHAG